jgi:Flp pilus assembly pilin Flp
MFNSVSAWLGVFALDAHDRITNVTRREEGQAVVEYALILGLVVVGAIALLIALGGNVKGKLQSVNTALGIS